MLNSVTGTTEKVSIQIVPFWASIHNYGWGVTATIICRKATHVPNCINLLCLFEGLDIHLLASRTEEHAQYPSSGEKHCESCKEDKKQEKT